jgi:hypothetical protein
VEAKEGRTPVTIAWRKVDAVFLLILLAAVLIRLLLAATELYVHDEANTSIPLAELISFAPDDPYLPIRAVNHPALPAYIVKASGALFGTTPLGYRMLHLLMGICGIVWVYLVANRAYGPVAARWAAALVAFNEYFLSISARATAHTPFLVFSIAAIYAFSRFLDAGRPVHLYAAAASVSLAFYCKEHAVLLLPVFFVALLHAAHRRWFTSRHLYLAGALFLLLIGPDAVWNVTAQPDAAPVTYGGRSWGVAQATYTRHLRRIGGLGLSPYPLMFYTRDTLMPLARLLTEEGLDDNTPEYYSMNSVIGVMMLVAVALATARRTPPERMSRFLLIVFWGVFGFFSLVRRGNPDGLDPVSWIWADVSMIPAVILAAAWLAGRQGRWRVILWTTCGLALLFASARVVLSGPCCRALFLASATPGGASTCSTTCSTEVKCAPMITIRKSEDRGRADRDWLDSHFTFSFGPYHDPAHTGFRALRVMNEDRIAPGKGFGPHAHRDMEIVTYVMEGRLAHRDSMNEQHTLGPNEIQTMSAGDGIVHSEFNASDTEPVHSIQIWIDPRAEDLTPSYQQIAFDPSEKRGRLRLLAGPERSGPSPMTVINQDARLYVAELGSGETVTHALAPGRHAWAQVLRGAISVNGRLLREGDGAAISDERSLTLAAAGPERDEFLLFDLS